MGKKTKIETFDSTWNPVTGCSHGCAYCYARNIATRFRGTQAYPHGFEPTLREDRLDIPKKWTRGRMIFVCSMADLFGEWVPDEWIVKVFDACKAAPQHDYFFLTKNPGRYRKLFDKGLLPDLPNFWFGSSVTRRGDGFQWFDRFSHWFLSIEPLLEDLGSYTTAFKPHWIIIGAETGNRKDKVVPEKKWVESIVAQFPGVPVYMKPSLAPVMGEADMRTELPALGGRMPR